MWLSLITIIVSSLEIPIHFIENKAKYDIPDQSLVNSQDSAPVYLNTSDEFFIVVDIGGQKTHLFLNPNSDYLVVASHSCYCSSGAPPLYYPSESSTSSRKWENYDEINSGTFKYNPYADDITVNHLTAHQQYFLQAEEHYMFPYKISGFLGFGDTTSNKFSHNFVRNLWEEKRISRPLYSLALQNPNLQKYNSVITFGEYDFNKFSNGQKTTIKSNPSWSFTVTSFSLDQESENLRDGTALFRPSENAIKLPPREYRIYLTKLKEKFYCPYNTIRGFIFCQCI